MIISSHATTTFARKAWWDCLWKISLSFQQRHLQESLLAQFVEQGAANTTTTFARKAFLNQFVEQDIICAMATFARKACLPQFVEHDAINATTTFARKAWLP